MSRKDVKVVVAGAAGRMGRMLLAAVHATAGLKLAGALERPGHPMLGKDAGEAAGMGALGLALVADGRKALGQADLLIDFTTPEATLEHLDMASALGKKMVIGTTGLKPDQVKRVAAFSKKQACVFSSNFSVGMNLLWKAVALIASTAGNDFDVEIIEAHHHFKKDSPSGTALTTGQVVAEALGLDLEKAACYGRRGSVGERPRGQIGIHAVRAGDIVGDHTVLFAGPGERLEFIHRAHSRENFASGAARAARWLGKKQKGLFSMQDVLGLKA